jgi:hypothetical protein
VLGFRAKVLSVQGDIWSFLSMLCEFQKYRISLWISQFHPKIPYFMNVKVPGQPKGTVQGIAMKTPQNCSQKYPTK